MRLPGFRRWLGGGDDPRRLIDAAGQAGRERRFRDAATLYAEALRVRPDRGDLHVQAGHMFKEARDYGEAERHYRRAAELMPRDADLALQLGHFHKTVGRLADAEDAYAHAATLAPDWNEPRKELGDMRAAGWRRDGAHDARDTMPVSPPDLPDSAEVSTAYGALAPERLPRPLRRLLTRSEPSVNVSQFGVPLNTFWGMRRVARGVEAVRGFCISVEPVLTVTALVNGLTLRHSEMKGPHTLEYEADPERIHKYVFNLWCDFSPFLPGRYSLELRFHDQGSLVRTHHEEFVVEPPLREADHPDCDALFTPELADPRSLDEQVDARPSIIHEAVGTRPSTDVRAILLIRTDQLGDVVASVPAMLRVRELYPAARLVGLFGPANVDIARSLGLFDDLILTDFRESMRLRTRTLGWEEQVALKEALTAFRFDVAIDLATSNMSRPLLALSGARFLYGFDDTAWPRLSASVSETYHDPKTRREMATHATRVLALIEQLPLLLGSRASVIRRDDLARDRLRAWGIGADERYAAIHTGARIVPSRWGHYPELAERLHSETDLKIVMFIDPANPLDRLPPGLAASERVVVVDRQLPFDEFDALLSFASVYVGNDSGPKHLAALRGVPVVSIHSARINWREWGQEQTGVIITRKLPCAGCSLYHDVDECGRDWVCVSAIRLEEVYRAVRRYV